MRLHHWLLRSEAWRNASLGSKCLLIELYDLYNGTNNGDLFLSVREAATRLGVGKNLANRLFTELETKGFIKARDRGAFSRKVRHATRWILTEFICDGELPTKAFMKWRPTGENQKPVPTTGTYGLRQRDRDAPTVPVRETDGPQEKDRDASFERNVGPRQRDTVSIPGRGEGGARSRQASAARRPNSDPWRQ